MQMIPSHFATQSTEVAIQRAAANGHVEVVKLLSCG
ncbi:hypothetical protein BN1013_02136 [Candidatus Rubidus massiliensis]|nr:hypothetical protein BN1013_02136 [Candidatus Rubidus massiliensis]